MKTAIFLGAGASKAEGASTQDELFKEYFKLLNNRYTHPNEEMVCEIKKFFKIIFDIDTDNPNLENIDFPIFEEAFGILDLADVRNESFKDFSNLNITTDSGKLKFLRIYLILLMAEVIDNDLKEYKGLHMQLINNLAYHDKLKDIIFLTTNYDILIDNALTHLFERGILMDYGVDFINYDDSVDEWKKPDENSIKLFKLHGSLNWLYCSTCNHLKLTPLRKGVINLITNPNEAKCKYCGTIYSPIIVPPTFFKDFTNIYLNIIWNKAETYLREVEHIIFCGYSFNDSDMYIKYLLKRIQKNRNSNSNLKVTVINNHTGKSFSDKNEEELKYKRFLGSRVNYTSFSFEDFVNDPISIINRS